MGLGQPGFITDAQALVLWRGTAGGDEELKLRRSSVCIAMSGNWPQNCLGCVIAGGAAAVTHPGNRTDDNHRNNDGEHNPSRAHSAAMFFKIVVLVDHFAMCLAAIR